MKKSILIIIFSIFTASLFIPGGYGSWTDVLTIKGIITVVEPPPPPPIPTPTPTPTPVPGAIIPDVNAEEGITPEGNPASVEAGSPSDIDNTGSIIPEEDNDVIESNAGDNQPLDSDDTGQFREEGQTDTEAAEPDEQSQEDEGDEESSSVSTGDTGQSREEEPSGTEAAEPDKKSQESAGDKESNASPDSNEKPREEQSDSDNQEQAE